MCLSWHMCVVIRGKLTEICFPSTLWALEDRTQIVSCSSKPLYTSIGFSVSSLSVEVFDPPELEFCAGD